MERSHEAEKRGDGDIFFYSNIDYIYVYFHVSLCVGASATAHIWVSEDSLQTAGFFFCHVGPGAQTEVGKLVSKHLRPLSHLGVFLKLLF